MFDVADRTLRSEGEDRMVTAFVGIIDPKSMTMVYASAGHPPALLRTTDGRVTELYAPGPPIGLRYLSEGARSTVDLPQGSRLLLYTDGLIEWSRDVTAGEALLQKHFAEAPDSGDPHPAKSLIDAVLPKTGARDDVAALTVAIAARPS
jgi:serine phosphatase RsbU (regulator of sigma subunit)